MMEELRTSETLFLYDPLKYYPAMHAKILRVPKPIDFSQVLTVSIIKTILTTQKNIVNLTAVRTSDSVLIGRDLWSVLLDNEESRLKIMFSEVVILVLRWTSPIFWGIFDIQDVSVVRYNPVFM